MKVSKLLLKPWTISLLQFFVSTWFILSFFLADESLTVDRIWKSSSFDSNQRSIRARSLIYDAIKKHCHQRSDDPDFSKIILVVIDALGSDFIPTIEEGLRRSRPRNSTMPFVESKIRARQALGMVARAATPTVTMPRIKAILSGTLPSFLDIAYNLAADVSNFQDDNLVGIAKKSNKSIVFYGDDTWLSLFKRSTFKRLEETFSFFASDYTTVDTNVTKRAMLEIEPQVDDWDMMILHYLGLDHIGHVFGTNSNTLIRKKLMEMDSVISAIYEKMSERDDKSLIVICGDHGMSSEGNHGGASSLEANTAVIFLPINSVNGHSYKAHGSILQIDLAVTLSNVLGLPIPEMSKGVVIHDFLIPLWAADTNKFICATLRNIHQLVRLGSSKDTLNDFHIDSLLKELDKSIPNYNEKSVEDLYDLAKKIQSALLARPQNRQDLKLVVISIIAVSLLTLRSAIKTFRDLAIELKRGEQIYCLLLLVLPIVLQGSTDYIESEHVFWPIFSYASLAILFLVLIPFREMSRVWVRLSTEKLISLIQFPIVILLVRFKLRNDTNYLSTLIAPVISTLFLYNYIRQILLPKKLVNSIMLSLSVTILFAKYIEEYQFDDGVTSSNYKQVIQRFSLLTLTAFIVSSRFESTSSRLSTFMTSWSFMTFLLSRRYNFLYMWSNMQLEGSVNECLDKIKATLATRVLLYIVFAQSAFFCQGNTNLFSSLDIMPAFYAQTEFNLFLSVVFIAVATFSSQMFWIIKLFQRIIESKSGSSRNDTSLDIKVTRNKARSQIRDIILNRNFMIFSYYSFVCLVLRNHLFIWSVISPKLVYLFVNNTVQILLVNVTFVISNVAYEWPRKQKGEKYS